MPTMRSGALRASAHRAPGRAPPDQAQTSSSPFTTHGPEQRGVPRRRSRLIAADALPPLAHPPEPAGTGGAAPHPGVADALVAPAIHAVRAVTGEAAPHLGVADALAERAELAVRAEAVSAALHAGITDALPVLTDPAAAAARAVLLVAKPAPEPAAADGLLAPVGGRRRRAAGDGAEALLAGLRALLRAALTVPLARRPGVAAAVVGGRPLSPERGEQAAKSTAAEEPEGPPPGAARRQLLGYRVEPLAVHSRALLKQRAQGRGGPGHRAASRRHGLW